MKDNYDERIRHLEAEIDRLKRGRLEYQRPVTLESLTHTMPAGMWTNYTPASQTGWTALPEGTYKYSVIGNIVFLYIDMTAGTSNATAARINLPVNADLSSSYGGVNAMAMDNGVVLEAATKWYIGGTIQEITFGSNMGNGLWTASGTKRMRVLAIYVKGT